MNSNVMPPQPGIPPWYPMPAAPAPVRAGRGFAIAGFVLSALALVGVLAIAAWLVFTSPAGDSGRTEPLTGQLAKSPGGAALTGADLSTTITARIDQDGGNVTEMTCPRTAAVRQGVMTVCHGVISDSPWAVVVYFETAAGRFTLEPV